MTDLFDTIDPASVLSLTELNRNIKQALRDALPETYWVRAETSEVRVNSYSGHCYLEFVEKDERTGQVAARARGTIWAQQYAVIRPYFEEETGRPFTSGLKVLVRVAVDFHELYGLSLTVHDIDPSFTVGDLVRRRKEIIRQLQADGVFDLNRALSLPARPQRIAVISSATAAGYEDFTDQLLGNEYGFPFYVRLYPALMQGERTEASIIAALDRIYAVREAFDVVVIIRGGGSTADLSSFDSYALAANCAQFPLPIITGIGHERDDTVVDLVAHTRLKTPTAVAAFLIDCMATQLADINELRDRLYRAATARMLSALGFGSRRATARGVAPTLGTPRDRPPAHRATAHGVASALGAPCSRPATHRTPSRTHRRPAGASPQRCGQSANAPPARPRAERAAHPTGLARRAPQARLYDDPTRRRHRQTRLHALPRRHRHHPLCRRRAGRADCLSNDFTFSLTTHFRRESNLQHSRGPSPADH